MAKAKAVQFKLITEGKDLNSLIKSIANRGKLLDRDLHVAGVSALYHAYTHGSTAFAQQLIEAIGASGRKGALKKWLFHFGCFMVKEDNKTLGIDKDLKVKGFDAISKDAIATPFWKLTADKDDVEFVDAMAQVCCLLYTSTRTSATSIFPMPRSCRALAALLPRSCRAVYRAVYRKPCLHLFISKLLTASYYKCMYARALRCV